MRLALGDFGLPDCASATNLSPAESGEDGIGFSPVPGAHRIVVLPSSLGWRMTLGVPQMDVFTLAGFYTRRDIAYPGPDGKSWPAREYRMTPKGYLHAWRSNRDCYEFTEYARVELLSAEPIPVPERLSGFGKAYRATFHIHASAFRPWAQTPEFHYVFTNASTVAQSVRAPRKKDQVFFLHKDRWYSEREAIRALVIDTTALGANDREQQRIQAARDGLAAHATKRRMARLDGMTLASLRAGLEQEDRRHRLAPCLDLPVREADRSRGFRKNEGPPTFVLYDEQERRDATRHEHARAFLQRLVKAGLATTEPFDGEPFPGARPGSGQRFVLVEKVAAALDPLRPSCLPLGAGRLEELRLGPVAMDSVSFRGWLRLTEPMPWTAALAVQFPNVKAIIDQGFGLMGKASAKNWSDPGFRLQAPHFSAAPPFRRNRFDPIVEPTADPAIVDQEPGQPVRMAGMRCDISADGTEVTATKFPCTRALATRAFHSGKAYAEIAFRSTGPDTHPETWTNAAVTSKRSLSSLSTGAASVSFAGSFNKRQVKHGDVISVALDMDERVLYWRLNGQWMTGRPGTGLGAPLVNLGEAYFIAASVQKPHESWQINFGATPFRFPPPDGFPPYGGDR